MARKGKGPDAWPVRADLYWCPDRNVPVVGKECPDGSRARLVRITEPGDARPAFDHDIGSLRAGYERETGGTGGFEELRGSSVVLFNKVPFMDLMYEVVSDGAVIGRLYWEPLEGSWRFRFSQPGLDRVWHREPLPVLRVPGGLRALRRRKIYPNTPGLPPGTQVALVDESGEPVAVGYVHPDGDRIKAHTVFWKRKPARLSTRPSTWDDAVSANDYYIYYHSARAVKFIHVMNEKVGKPVIVSYSGGKDSLAALSLTLETGIRPYVLFNNTGIEMPETVESVRRIVEEYGLELLVADAGDAFWRAVERVGPPGKDYRWCCKVTKLAPLSRLLQEKFPDGALNIVGQRAFESLDRARSPRVWRNRWLPQILNISPIQEWTQLIVWLYIWKRRLPYNPLYEKGFDRIGCFMCPAAFMAEYRHVQETHPDLWEKWERVLRKWARRLGLSGEAEKAYVEKGLWRWLTPAVQKQRLAQRLRVELPDWREQYRKWLEPALEEFRYGEEGGEMVLADPGFPAEAIRDQYTVLGAYTVEDYDGERIILRGPGRVRVDFSRNRVRVEGKGGVFAREMLFDAYKLAYRWVNCAGCKSCEASCPTGAIRVVRENGRYIPRVDPGKCIHCKLCLDNCPLADVTVERIIPALALGEPTAWRRSGRRTKESVIRRYLALKGYRVPEDRAALVDEDVLVMPPGFMGEAEG